MPSNRTFAAVFAGLLATCAAGSAAAQDWTGPYIALHVGGGLMDDDQSETILFDTNLNGVFTDNVNTSTGANAFASTATVPAGFCGGKANAGNFAAGCISDDQVEGEYGLRAGYDMGFGGFVVGGLVEVSGFGVSDQVNGFSTTPANYQFERGLKDAMFSVRARAGLPVDRMLFYATAGAAFATIEERFVTSNTTNAFAPIEKESDAKGYQFGGGMEFRVNDRVSLGAEYLYTGLEVDSPLVTRITQGTAPATNPFILVNASGTDTRRESDEFNFHAFRLTISSRF